MRNLMVLGAVSLGLFSGSSAFADSRHERGGGEARRGSEHREVRGERREIRGERRGVEQFRDRRFERPVVRGWGGEYRLEGRAWRWNHGRR